MTVHNLATKVDRVLERAKEHASKYQADRRDVFFDLVKMICQDAFVAGYNEGYTEGLSASRRGPSRPF